MPASAIKTGYIDDILPIEDIARKIAQIADEFPGKDKVSVRFGL
jgi:chemotaxis response regulator CheB